MSLAVSGDLLEGREMDYDECTELTVYGPKQDGRSRETLYRVLLTPEEAAAVRHAVLTTLAKFAEGK